MSEMFQLIKEAQEMLLDRPKDVQDLIYHIAKLDAECRSGIIIAYDILYGNIEKKEKE